MLEADGVVKAVQLQFDAQKVNMACRVWVKLRTYSFRASNL